MNATTASKIETIAMKPLISAVISPGSSSDHVSSTKPRLPLQWRAHVR
jgi:hypothetical protein